jgi:hypothetical protein
MILASYGADFKPLSRRHEALIDRVARLVESFSRGEPCHPTYATIGTFGAGKTQFLYWLHRKALESGLIPVLVLAEDLFAEVIRGDKQFTQGDVALLVKRTVDGVLQALGSQKPTAEIAQVISMLIDPRGNSAVSIRAVVDRFGGKVTGNARPVLLVDELEGQYRTLQQRVRTPGDRSPLRELFEAPYLKFFALAPAGIYEMGGADQTRAIRLVIPPADIRYVRTNIVSNVGRANSCWWLSRGKARHLFKACAALKDAGEDLGAAEASRIIREELDQIGQPPTEVPAAVTEGLAPSKRSSLLDLAPSERNPRRCYIVDAHSLDEGKLAECVGDTFKLHSDVALLFAGYFRVTALALSDGKYSAPIPDGELSDILCLSLDHMLEYEYGNPDLVQHMGDVLALYERFRADPGAVHGSIGRLWDCRQSSSSLPLSIGEVRGAFPFPLMNPIVKGHDPQAIQRRWEGKGFPLWSWTSGAVTCWFFASARDYIQFLESDDFACAVLPEGCSALCVLPPQGTPHVEPGFAQWCRANGKLNTHELPQLLGDFLLSGAGELSGSLPGDLQAHLKAWAGEKGDVLLNRKAQIYSDALGDIVAGALPQPKLFCKDSPPDADSVWGSTQVADRVVAVISLALAWSSPTPDQKAVLAQLRDLFRSGKDERGSGDLNKLKPRPGVIGIADDLLPRYGRSKALADSNAVGRLQSYWSSGVRTELERLAHQVPLERFLKLTEDENKQRLLESLWRSARNQFVFKDRVRSLEDSIASLEGEVLPVVDLACKLEKRAKDVLGVPGIEFEDSETLVKAADGLRKLLQALKSCTGGAGSAAHRGLLELYGSSLDLSKAIKALRLSCEAIERAVDRLQQSGGNLEKNFWEYPRAVAYLEIAPDELAATVGKEKVIGQSCTLGSMAQTIADRAARLDEVNEALGRLEAQLGRLGDALVVTDEEGA